MRNVQHIGELAGASDEEVMHVIRTGSRIGFGLPLAAIDELQYRFYKKMQEATASLVSSSHTLTEATESVKQEVSLVKDSSKNLENLTERLNRLTWWLILLTVFAVAMPIGIEVWKAYHETLPAPVVVQILPKP